MILQILYSGTAFCLPGALELAVVIQRRMLGEPG